MTRAADLEWQLLAARLQAMAVYAALHCGAPDAATRADAALAGLEDVLTVGPRRTRRTGQSDGYATDDEAIAAAVNATVRVWHELGRQPPLWGVAAILGLGEDGLYKLLRRHGSDWPTVLAAARRRK